jgi:hypothetical protein
MKVDETGVLSFTIQLALQKKKITLIDPLSQPHSRKFSDIKASLFTPHKLIYLNGTQINELTFRYRVVDHNMKRRDTHIQ